MLNDRTIPIGSLEGAHGEIRTEGYARAGLDGTAAPPSRRHTSVGAPAPGQDVRVFGSVALGEADNKSDLDLLVDFEPGRGLLDHGGLWLDLNELLGGKVDVVSERGLKPRIRRRVLRDARHSVLEEHCSCKLPLLLTASI
jgi:predicted nucleotidyltransferase